MGGKRKAGFVVTSRSLYIRVERLSYIVLILKSIRNVGDSESVIP